MNNISNWSTIISILVAVVIFAFKEYLDRKRQKETNKNKINAIKFYLARSCEINNWSLKQMKRNIYEMREYSNLTGFCKKTGQDGRVTILYPIENFAVNGEIYRQESIIPNVNVEEFKQLLILVAELNPKLSLKLESAITGISELKHVRDSLIGYFSNEDENGDNQTPFHWESFPEYALSELDDTFECLDALYRACTGKPLQDHRVR